MQKSLFGGIKTDNLIKHTCFNLKISQFHVFYLKVSQVHVICSNFSQVCMFFNDNFSKVLPQTMQPAGSPS